MRGSRVTAAVLVAALVAGGGFLLGRAQREPARQTSPSTAGAAQPLQADPLLPPQPTPKTDPDYPPLSENLSWAPASIGSGPFRYSWVVPRGWERIPLQANETRWVPAGNPPDSQLIRVEVVASQYQTQQSILLDRIDMLRSATGVRDLKLLKVDLKQAILQYSYVNEPGYLRFNTLHWISLDGNDTAQIEVAVEGRAIDRPGLAAMSQRVWESVHQTS